ncbi:Transposon TX1 uncharacterized 149 kDa protein [Linum grandiflorum]
MIFLSWNCRGLGQPRSVQALSELVSAHRPDVVFLSETLVGKQSMEKIRSKVKFDGCLGVENEGHSGGLAVLWRDRERVKVLSFSRNYIDMEVLDEFGVVTRFTGFYGMPERSRRRESWDLLRSLALENKKGRLEHPQNLIQGFRDAVSDCQLFDLPLLGYPYTWTKAKGKPHAVEERLDRSFAMSSWIDLYPEAELHNLVAALSDHSPLLLRTTTRQEWRPMHRFRFENQWWAEHDVKQVVLRGWADSHGGGFLGKLDGCRCELLNWSKSIRVNFRKDIRDLKQKMEIARACDDSDAVDTYEQNRGELLKVLQREETYWQQRAKHFWRKDGERNTRYFHRVANGRRKRKRIYRLRDELGGWAEQPNEMAAVASTYFRSLFQTQATDIRPIMRAVNRKVLDEDNRKLLAPFSNEEIRRALFDMHPDKAPGPDGFNPGFYQKMWGEVGEELAAACREWLDMEEFPMEVQATTIVLLPKVESPEKMTELRPISLCNVLYRVVAKALENRLRKVLPQLIGDEQSAFIRGRSIFDNIVVAFESLHYMKTKPRTKQEFAALKVDISKAYDRVEWHYMEGLMSKLGFAPKWICWMMMCISSVEYRVLLNEELGETFRPARGLRQGCPLSPFLFLLCAEGLSALLRREEKCGRIQGVRVSRDAPRLTHLLFADDSFFFFRAGIREARALRKVFDVYAAASGQVINYDKSGIFFTRTIDPSLARGVSYILDVDRPLDTGRYLGLPSMVGRKKKATLQYLRERLWSRLRGWRRQFTTNSGKEILIKTVAQAIPTFCMNVFLLPVTFAEELERMLNSFWWGTKTNEKGGIAWLRWEKMCVSKDKGGMGFRSLMDFNLAMLGKHGWRFLQEPNALVSRVIKARYFPKGDFLTAKVGYRPSYVWRSMFAAQDLVRDGIRWRIGDGAKVNVWSEPWLRDEENCYPITIPSMQLSEVTVNELVRPGLRTWDHDLVCNIFVSVMQVLF